MSLLKVYTYSKRVVPKQSSLLTLLNSFNSSKKSSGLSDKYEVLSNRPAIQSYPRRDLLSLSSPITLCSWWGESSKLTCKDFLGVWKGRNTWTQKRVSWRGASSRNRLYMYASPSQRQRMCPTWHQQVFQKGLDEQSCPCICYILFWLHCKPG